MTYPSAEDGRPWLAAAGMALVTLPVLRDETLGREEDVEEEEERCCVREEARSTRD